MTMHTISLAAIIPAVITSGLIGIGCWLGFRGNPPPPPPVAVVGEQPLWRNMIGAWSVPWAVPRTDRGIPLLVIGAARDGKLIADLQASYSSSFANSTGLVGGWGRTEEGRLGRWLQPLASAGSNFRDVQARALDLIPPRAGQPLYLQLTSPDDDGSWPNTRDWRPSVLERTQDGWRLTIDAVKATNRDSHGEPQPCRLLHVLNLDPAVAGPLRIDLVIRWHTELGLSGTFEATTAVQTGSLSLNIGDAVSAPIPDVARDPAPRLTKLEGEPRPGANGPGAWQPPWSVSMGTKEIQPPAKTPIGLIAGSGIPMPAWFGGMTLAQALDGESGVGILGPIIEYLQYATVRSIRWEGSTATITIGVWTDNGPRNKNYFWQPILAVPLRRPPDVKGPVSVRLVWEHRVADAPWGIYHLKEAAFGGVQRLDGVILP